jgi:TolB-like protein/Tfp pilus assembly protein PilF
VRRLNKFLSELRRRSVFNVGAAYLATAWLSVQVVADIGPMLEFPPWVPRFVLGALALGFPVALVLAWIYELTDQGLRKTTEVDQHESLRPAFGRTLNVILIVSLTMALGYFFWESRIAVDSPAEGSIDSVAVLPFRDFSASQDQAHFAEGMAEELLNALSRLPDLKVAGRSSAFSFAADTPDLRAVGERLGVSHLLIGSVRTAASRLRVSAQLIRASDGFQIWSRVFDREAADVFAVQDEIAELVVEALRIGGETDKQVDLRQRPRTADLHAYDRYLLGRYQLALRTAPSLESAVLHFREAIDHDPAFSPAWSGLATALVVSPYYSPVPDPMRLASEVKAAAQTAIDLDPSHGEAHAVLGTAILIFDRAWDLAAEFLHRAVRLHPHDATIVNLYGDYLYAVGDYRAALHYEGLAAELEPLSAYNQHELALVLDFLARHEEAIQRERLAIKLGPDFANARIGLVRMLIDAGRLEEAGQLIGDQVQITGPATTLYLGALLRAAEGDRDGALQLADEAMATYSGISGSVTHIAYLYAVLGEDAKAAGLVDLAYRERDPILVSPLYFFQPEDWPGMPRLQRSLAQPELVQLFELRRGFVSEGRGRLRAPRAEPGSVQSVVQR